MEKEYIAPNDRFTLAEVEGGGYVVWDALKENFYADETGVGMHIPGYHEAQAYLAAVKAYHTALEAPQQEISATLNEGPERLERLQISPADQMDRPNFHPYVVVYHLNDTQQKRIQNLSEQANRLYQIEGIHFDESPEQWFQGVMNRGSSHTIDNTLDFWERSYENFLNNQKAPPENICLSERLADAQQQADISNSNNQPNHEAPCAEQVL